MLADTCRHGRAQKADSHARSAAEAGRCLARGDSCGVLFAEVDDCLDENGPHELRSVADNLEAASEPEVAAEHVVERPREACLLPAANLTPLSLEGVTPFVVGALTLTASEGLHGPLGAAKDAWRNFSSFKTSVPVGGGFDTTRPGGVELRSEYTGLATLVHFPQVGRLKGSLVSEALDEWSVYAGLA